jgi:isocitrate dehydrogenase (NAD+)
VTAAVVSILETAGLQANWDTHLAGVLALERHGETLQQALLDSIRRTKVALKGPVTTPVGGGFTSVNVGLRKALNLFANLRPVWNIAGVPSRYTGVDLVIVRETGPRRRPRTQKVVPGVAESPRSSPPRHRRVSAVCVRARGGAGRRRVTAVHKANIISWATGCSSPRCATWPRSIPTSRRRSHRHNGCMQLVVIQQFDAAAAEPAGISSRSVRAGLCGGGACRANLGRRSAPSKPCTAAPVSPARRGEPGAAAPRS